MEGVKKGGDRQELHELIRTHSMAASRRVKEEGLDNDLLDRIGQDSRFGLSEEDLKKTLNPSDYVGRAPQQVMEFIKEEVDPVLEALKGSSLQATIEV